MNGNRGNWCTQMCTIDLLWGAITVHVCNLWRPDNLNYSLTPLCTTNNYNPMREKL